MTKQEKFQLVEELTKKLQEKPNVYITEAGGLTVDQVSNLRRMCFEAGVDMQVVKNTLLRKAMEQSGTDYSEVFDSLKQQSSVFFVSEAINEPAKVINKFRSKGKIEKPALKAAYIDEAAFFGDDSLKALENLKSKNELIADVVSLLQSPVMNLMGQLQSGGNTLSGLLKALEEK